LPLELSFGFCHASMSFVNVSRGGCRRMQAVPYVVLGYAHHPISSQVRRAKRSPKDRNRKRSRRPIRCRLHLPNDEGAISINWSRQDPLLLPSRIGLVPADSSFRPSRRVASTRAHRSISVRERSQRHGRVKYVVGIHVKTPYNVASIHVHLDCA
jgi:hypothetical protein